MLNEAQISLSGYVATQPVTRETRTGATNVSMRVAWTERRRDRVTGEWVDGNTSYLSVICWRRLGDNVAVCVRKGDPIVVKGKLSVRTYDDRQGVQRTAVEVEASSVGHDLSHGVASFKRVRPPTGMSANEFAASKAGSETSGDHPDDERAPADLSGRDGEDVPLPDEPDDAFFDEAAISGLVGDAEPAAAS